MCHVGTDSLLCSEAAVVLGGPAGRGDQPRDPPLQLEGQTSASRRCSVALGSCLQLSWANPVLTEGCPEQQPHNTMQSCVILLHHVRGKQGAGSRSRDAGCSLFRAIVEVGCACEFFLAAAEPKKRLKMKILVCWEAFFHGMLTSVFFSSPVVPTLCWLFVC